MPRPRRKRADIPVQPQAATAFTGQLTRALEHFTDAGWLGAHSPLAAPYFLGEHLAGRPDAHTAPGRGRALQELLQGTAAQLPERDPGGEYARHVLDATFFHPRPVFDDLLQELCVSRATYYRHRDKAIAQLEGALVRRVNPTLRLESPVAHPALLGRQAAAAECLAALRDNRTVMLAGPGGVGKTTLGAYLAAQLAQPFFWFTFCPNLNDQLSALLFSLGYFLHRQGASSLWLQLAADQGQVKTETAPGLVQHDLGTLAAETGRPLLCFDEIDLLRPAESQAHAQLVSFLESLRGLVPLLLMGQLPLIEADLQHTLAGLPAPAVRELFAQAGLSLSPEELGRLQRYTLGNPRLLELVIALHRAGEPLPESLQHLAANPSIEFLLNRMWRRLAGGEQAMLAALCVFRRPAPRAAWREQDILARLVGRRLIVEDDRGGVEVLPAFRGVIYDLLSPENRQILHRQAAAIRAGHGEYTAAAYHYLQGHQLSTAIQIWYQHRAQEISQGQAEAALAMFGQISRNEVRGQTREMLALLRGELYKLVGEYTQARQDLRSTLWQTAVLKAQASRLEGDMAEVRSEFGPALRAYQAGLETLESEVAQFHKNLGWVHMRQQDLDQAWREALLARYEAANLQGQIQVKLGNYTAACAFYEEALAIAESLPHAPGEAKTHKNLAALLTRQGEFQQAEIHWQKAGRYYERVGDRTNLASCKANQAFLLNQAGQHRDAIAPAREALALFEQLQQSYGRAVAAQNLAEAYLAVGDPPAAEQFARLVIQEEESRTMPDGLRVLGEIKLACGELDLAGQLIQQSIQVAQQNRDRFLEAYAWRALGQVYVAQDQPERACEALAQAIELFEALELPQEVEKTRAIRISRSPG